MHVLHVLLLVRQAGIVRIGCRLLVLLILDGLLYRLHRSRGWRCHVMLRGRRRWEWFWSRRWKLPCWWYLWWCLGGCFSSLYFRSVCLLPG